ncbi:uncharacterized protein [Drosophila virilis]|uniref:DUF4776 domain-containing protein n=1 Tax=Drosophila virilis TaxID=7244 RepID=A0A0Q9WGU4_DROVI|nr:uncharacterized protein LOC26531487 [Drosophila virilis]KRF83769.1 uncharacterized protein Dvir_GJ26717 [Drosophila virilis]
MHSESKKLSVIHESCNYLFDVIVTHFRTNKIKIQNPAQLQVDVNFNNQTLRITRSRINVTEFKTGSALEFKEFPNKLRKFLSKCGMPVSVIYNGRIIGAGQIEFPAMFTDRIEEGMSELMHADTCIFERESEIVGTLEILCRLYTKCDEKTKQEDAKCLLYKDKSINPQDIMFVMGENQQCPNQSDLCPDVMYPDEDDDRLKLDLLRYRSSNGNDRRPTATFMHNPVANNAAGGMKQMARDCEQIIDSIIKRTGQPQQMIDEVDSTVEPPPTLPNVPRFSQFPASQANNNELCNPKVIPVPISEIEKPSIKPIRFCPVCLTNMSWLPKFAACPNCGVKPMPVIEERHKEKKLTADQIVSDLLGKPFLENMEDFCSKLCTAPAAKNANEDQQLGCRCTCKNGKICAHCRIRKICSDIFQGDEGQPACPEAIPKSSEVICLEDNNVEKCRPHLARVFSELRELYNIKESKLTHGASKECGQYSSPNKNPQEVDAKPKGKLKAYLPKINRSSAENTAKLRKANVEQRQISCKIGHKSCVSQRGAVPPNHGWAWPSSKLTRKYGWQPGFVRKSIKKIMRFFLQYLPERTALDTCVKEKKADMESSLPILNVCKKKGEVFITLRAVNNKDVEIKPIVFKVVKSDFAVALSEIKRKLKAKGFPKCSCHKTLMLCTCRSYYEKKYLEHALQKECKRRGMVSCVNELVLTDTSDSEMEYDFDVTPPAGFTQARTVPKPLTVSHSTQCIARDSIALPRYPIKYSPYWRAYDCAAGDRYTGTAFGAPAEEVFEDGSFGSKGGGVHGESATPGAKTKDKAIRGKTSRGPMRASHAAKKKPNAAGLPEVRVPKRFEKKLEEASRARENAVRKEITQKKLGINMMKYLQKHGAFSKKRPAVGPDGLTDAQRRCRALRQVPPPPIEFVTQLGKGFNPCTAGCCNSYGNQCLNPCYYRC